MLSNDEIEFVDVLVIGAGPSGCVASAYLKQNNVDVKVVEKAKFPRPVIGESFIPRVMDHFEEVGLIEDIKAAGFEKKWGARFIKDGDICVFDFSKKFTKGWDWTWQVPRDHFDDVVAKSVQKKGVNIEFESEVTDVIFEENQVTTKIKLKNGDTKTVLSKYIIDASGFGRVLPKILDLDQPSSIPQHASVFTHLEDVNRPKDKDGTLITFDILSQKVWLWVIPFSNGKTSIGVVAPTEFLEDLTKDKTEEEALRYLFEQSDFYNNRFRGVDYLFPPVILKNYSCSVKKLYGDRFVLTGNSSEFLDPVFSSGVSFATESGILAAKLITKQLNGIDVNWEVEYKEYMKKGLEVFSTYVKEWYTGNLQTLFFHKPSNPDVKSKICAVLAGYVWDQDNPFVKKHEKAVANMAYTIEMAKK